jgi:LysM repeat protein
VVLTARTFDRRSLSLRNEFGATGEKIKSRRKYWYKVRSGDSLYTIAQKAGISASRLVRINGLRMSSTIRAGRRLRLR